MFGVSGTYEHGSIYYANEYVLVIYNGFSVLMGIDRNIGLLILAACLAVVTGCASTATAPKSFAQIASATDAHTPMESAILAEIPGMKPGDRGAAENVSFIAGEIYTAASGKRCMPVTLTESPSVAGGSKDRVVCESGQNWFFPKDVFLTGSVSD